MSTQPQKKLYSKIITDKETLKSEIPRFKDFRGLVAYDTETTGLSVKDKIIGYSFTLDDEELTSYYIVLYTYDKENDTLIKLDTYDTAISLLNNWMVKQQLIMHNATFDCKMTFHSFGVDLTDSLHSDTALQRHTLDPSCSTRFRLKELGDMYWPGSSSEQQDLKESIIANGGKYLKKEKEFFKCDIDILGTYAIQDTLLTMKLHKKQDIQLDIAKLKELYYDNEVMPLLRLVTIPMNTKGVAIDIAKCDSLILEIDTKIEELEKSIYTDLDHIKIPFADTLNVGSGSQLSWLLFSYFGEVPKKLTASGQVQSAAVIGKKCYNRTDFKNFISKCKAKDIPFYKYLSSDAETLGEYRNKYPWLDKLLTLKKEKKIRDTYLKSILAKRVNTNIYPSFNQGGTKTGRFSSSSPNFQNLPSRDKRVKSCIIPRPGKVFIGNDFDQLEPRILAHTTNDPEMIAAFNSGMDFYATIGIPALNLNTDEYSNDPKSENFLKKTTQGTVFRDISKEIALSTAYNVSPNQMRKSIKKRTGIEKSLKETQSIIEGYLDSFNTISNYMDTVKSFASKNGYIYNMFGRRLPLPKAKLLFLRGATESSDWNYKHEMNISCNYPIQSSAGGIMNRCGIEMAKQLKAKPEWGAQIVLQVHDEYIVEGNEEYKEEIMEVVRSTMENTVKLRVPLTATPSPGYTLAECK